jgi:hypothetical protein
MEECARRIWSRRSFHEDARIGPELTGGRREGSKYGIEEFMDLKYICIGGV